MPEDGRICRMFLNMLKMSQYTVLTMPELSPRYSSMNIIIVTFIILEFLSAGFAHPGARLPFYLFLTRLRT